MKMSKPTDLDSLVKYLSEHPGVIMLPPRGNAERRTFLRFEGGKLWWMNELGQERHMPITELCAAECESKPLLTFKETGFYVHAFSNDWWFTYDN
jgi:hypothetical protein